LEDLRWKDVDLPRRSILLVAENTKANKSRRIPISARLAAVMEMIRTDPAGKEYGPDRFVFGELGSKLGDTKKAFNTAVLKAHGHCPAWRQWVLAAASIAALDAIDLHFHDLRREAASRRYFDQGWSLVEVQELLGHATLEQTRTSLSVPVSGLQNRMKESDEAARCNLVANGERSGLPTNGNGAVVEQKQVTVN